MNFMHLLLASDYQPGRFIAGHATPITTLLPPSA